MAAGKVNLVPGQVDVWHRYEDGHDDVINAGIPHNVFIRA